MSIIGMLFFLFGITMVLMVNSQNTDPRAICNSRRGLHARANCLMVQRWVQTRNRIVEAGLVNKEIPSVSAGTGLNTVFGAPSAQAAAGQPPLSEVGSMTGCLDIPCYCKAIGGNTNSDDSCTLVRNGVSTRLGKAVRQEYRTLTPDQRAKFHRALHALKFGTQRNTYNTMVFWHQAPQAPIAHGGPMFPVWHREFIKLMEFYLREVDPSITGLPYWDSTMDNELDDARDSVLWSAELMGEARNGRVINGDFANWTNLNSEPLRRTFPWKNGLISATSAKQIPDYDMLSIYAFTSPDDSCANPDEVRSNFEPLEYVHGGPHNFVGGDMSGVWTSPNDPVFFLHHCFIDKLYEDWRTKQDDPETLYPESQIVDDQCAHINNSLSKPMIPFNDVMNKLGLDAGFTENLYNYKASPTCTRNRGCGSPYLFCSYNPSAHCVAKIRVGGTCRKFSKPPTPGQSTLPADQTNPCYKGRCVNGKCQGISLAIAVPGTIVAQAQLPIVELTGDQKGKIKMAPFRDCYNNHECCPKWSKDGYCKNATEFMNVWCSSSCLVDGCKQKPVPTECVDLHPSCKMFLAKKSSECQVNQHWMTANCAKSCGQCKIFESIDKQCGGGPAGKGFFVSQFQLEE